MQEPASESKLWLNLLRALGVTLAALLVYIGYVTVSISRLTADIKKEYEYIHKGENNLRDTSQAIQKLRHEINQTPDSLGAVENLMDTLCANNNIRYDKRNPRDPEKVSNLVQANSTEYVFGNVDKDRLLKTLKELEESKRGLTVTTLDMIGFERGAKTPNSCNVYIHWYSPIEQ